MDTRRYVQAVSHLKAGLKRLRTEHEDGRTDVTMPVTLDVIEELLKRAGETDRDT